MTTEEIAALAADIKQKMEALGQRTSDEALSAMVTAAVEKAAPFERKIVHGDDSLKGSRFGRLGVKTEDLQFAHAVLSSAGKRPSDDLSNAVRDLSGGWYANTDDWAHCRAMDTAETGYGLQLIGAQYVTDLWATAKAQSRVFGLIPQFDMTAPTAYLPVAGVPPVFSLVGESTAYNTGNAATTKTGSNRVSVTAIKLLAHQMWSGEMEEDSLIPFVPFLRAELADSLAFHLDSIVLNGDTTDAGTGNINLHDADPGATLYYLGFDGIRHAALVDNANNVTDCAGAVDYDKVLGLRGKMLDSTYRIDWGHPTDPNDLVFVGNPAVADSLCGLDEVITVDKYGPAATVLTGEVTKIGRHPFISSIAIALTEADGMVANSGNTKSQIVAFNRRGFVVGIRRAVKIETERIIGSDQSRIVLSTRLGFGRYSPTGAASGIEAAAVLYDIT
jgi:HK97 family phage major capsid protein